MNPVNDQLYWEEKHEMIAPNEIAARAKQKEDENYAFRTYLKGHADPEELDAQFLELHNELFADYDCNSC
jgi:hypothetical protein